MTATRADTSKQWLRRRLNTLDIYALAYPDIQSTYYFLVGFIALYAGEYTFLGALYGIVLMAAITLAYGEMGSRYPETGGSYLYVYSGFSALAAYISAWLLALDQILMVAYGAVCAAKIIGDTTGCEYCEIPIAVALSTALFTLALAGVKESAAVARAVATVDFSVMLALIALALLRHPASPPYFNWAGVGATNFLFALSLLSRGFTGIDVLGQLAGEAKSPLVQIPRAAVAIAITCAALGLGLTAAVMSALKHDAIAKDPALVPLYLAKEVHGVMAHLVAADLSLVMTLASLAGYLSFSRLLYMLAERHLLNPVFRQLQRRFRTPYVSLLTAYFISFAFIVTGGVELIIAVYAVGSLVNYLLVALSLARISRARALYAAFRTPLIAGIPLSAALGVVLISTGLMLTVIEKLRYIWILALWLLLGLLLMRGILRRGARG
ncbi:MAG: APC family permease [Thermoproteaceae archaeon]|jgi:APA family basic amino acid/polyamine antiporter|nr:APC family permease [Thermoproteaceae archaeon]